VHFSIGSLLRAQPARTHHEKRALLREPRRYSSIAKMLAKCGVRSLTWFVKRELSVMNSRAGKLTVAPGVFARRGLSLQCESVYRAASANSTRSVRPKAHAALPNVVNVTEGLVGSSNRSNAARLVFMRLAKASLVSFSWRMISTSL
jgi:hypothetical protein